MPKGRQNRSYRDGYWTGYREYRYGSERPAAHSAIFSGKKREAAIQRAMNVMQNWRLSPFEHEGAARTNIRSELCLAGFAWKRSDQEAAGIVEAALRRMGASRPTYAQGQREYALPREICAQCLGPLDDQDIADRRRFCSRECAEIKRVADARHYEYLMSSAWDHAARQRAKDRAPARRCAREGCDEEFRSVDPDARYCSLQCSAEAQRTVPEKVCQTCGAAFQPQNNKQVARFCSVECVNEGFKKIRVYAVCECCGTSFIAHNALGKYCSGRCKKTHAKFRSGRLPKYLTPPVFDYTMRHAPTVTRLTPAVFDEVVRLAA